MPGMGLSCNAAEDKDAGLKICRWLGAGLGPIGDVPKLQSPPARWKNPENILCFKPEAVSEGGEPGGGVPPAGAKEKVLSARVSVIRNRLRSLLLNGLVSLPLLTPLRLPKLEAMT